MAGGFSLDDYIDVAERIQRRAVRTDAGCLEWQGAIGSHGYGQLSVSGRLMLAHRAAYEARKGPIPAGLWIDHLCRNRRCVDPEHLEAVTPAVNTRRGIGRWTPEEVKWIRESPLSGGELGRQLGATRDQISKIRRRERHG